MKAALILAGALLLGASAQAQTTIRIYTVWTNAAATAAGGGTNPNDVTAVHIANLNASFTASGVNAVAVNAGVGVGLCCGSATAASSALKQVEYSYAVAAARDAASADITVLITGALDGDVGGQAGAIGDTTESAPNTAYAAVSYTALQDYAYEHEVGHILGTRHQRPGGSGGVLPEDEDALNNNGGNGHAWTWRVRNPIVYWVTNPPNDGPKMLGPHAACLAFLAANPATGGVAAWYTDSNGWCQWTSTGVGRVILNDGGPPTCYHTLTAYETNPDALVPGLTKYIINGTQTSQLAVEDACQWYATAGGANPSSRGTVDGSGTICTIAYPGGSYTKTITAAQDPASVLSCTDNHVLRWSNPSLQVQGYPSGSPTSNEAAAINANVARIATFHNTRLKPPLGAMIQVGSGYLTSD